LLQIGSTDSIINRLKILTLNKTLENLAVSLAVMTGRKPQNSMYQQEDTGALCCQHGSGGSPSIQLIGPFESIYQQTRDLDTSSS
jgi:hypothetical protein